MRVPGRADDRVPRDRKPRDRKRSPRARGLRLILLVTLGVFLSAGVWTAIVLVSEKSALEGARATLVAARSTGDLGVAKAALDSAGTDLRQASDRLGQAGPRLIAGIPLLGRPVSAARRTAEAGEAVVTSTQAVLAAAQPSRPLLSAGAVDVPALLALADTLDQAAVSTRRPVRELGEQSTGLLPGFVADPVRDAQDLLAPVPESFTKAGAGVRSLAGLLGSPTPRRMLVLLENNAELRGTGGLVTVFAEATVQDGRLSIDGFRDVKDLAGEPPDVERVPAPEDYRALWGVFLADTTLWVNANMTPDIPQASAVLAEIGARLLDVPPDAVLWLDVRTIVAVLDATGPAALPDGSPLTGANAVDVLLSEAYRGAEDTSAGQTARRGALRGAADVVLNRILGGTADPAALGLALSGAVGGRHLALWSAVPEEQQGLVDAGLAGDVSARGGDLMNFTAQNLGGGDRAGNKLDYYARREVTVDVTVGRDSASVRQSVVLRNMAPAQGLPRYVAGGVSPGTTNNLVTMAVPNGATGITFTRANRGVSGELRREGDHQVVTDAASLAPGTSASWDLTYRLPLTGGDYALRLIPQPLAFDADLILRVRGAEGVDLDKTPSFDGPFESVLTYDIEATEPGFGGRALDRVKRFWDEPVPAP